MKQTDYEKAGKELHKFIDRGISIYKKEYVGGKDVRFDCYVGFRMRMNDLEKKFTKDEVEDEKE